MDEMLLSRIKMRLVQICLHTTSASKFVFPKTYDTKGINKKTVGAVLILSC
jgi:hypothetical protein